MEAVLAVDSLFSLVPWMPTDTYTRLSILAGALLLFFLIYRSVRRLFRRKKVDPMIFTSDTDNAPTLKL